jgi:hydroxylaminobenzene mutase
MFFEGLVAGALVPAFANSRMGLSVHLAGVQTGTALVMLGLLWKHVALSERAEGFAALGNVASAWMILAALALAGIFGTSRSTPLAGAGFRGAEWQELLVSALLFPGSALMLAAWGAVLRGFHASAARR